jgi:hypothetical protein
VKHYPHHRNGRVKRTELGAFASVRRSGLIAVSLDGAATLTKGADIINDVGSGHDPEVAHERRAGGNRNASVIAHVVWPEGRGPDDVQIRPAGEPPLTSHDDGGDRGIRPVDAEDGQCRVARDRRDITIGHARPASIDAARTSFQPMQFSLRHRGPARATDRSPVDDRTPPAQCHVRAVEARPACALAARNHREPGCRRGAGAAWCAQARIFSASLARRLMTALVWIWQIRDSVTPSTSPICDSVIPSK